MHIQTAMTERQVAAELGISRTRVRQLEARALRKLREAIETEAERAGLEPREWIENDDT